MRRQVGTVAWQQKTMAVQAAKLTGGVAETVGDGAGAGPGPGGVSAPVAGKGNA